MPDNFNPFNINIPQRGILDAQGRPMNASQPSIIPQENKIILPQEQEKKKDDQLKQLAKDMGLPYEELAGLELGEKRPEEKKIILETSLPAIEERKPLRTETKSTLDSEINYFIDDLKRDVDKKNAQIFFHHFLKRKIGDPLAFNFDREMKAGNDCFNLEEFHLNDPAKLNKLIEKLSEEYFDNATPETRKVALLKTIYNLRIFCKTEETFHNWSDLNLIFTELLKQDYRRASLLAEHLLSFESEKISLHQAEQILEILQNKKRLAGDLAQMIFLEKPELREKFSSKENGIEQEIDKIKIEDFGDPQNFDHLSSLALNQADSLSSSILSKARRFGLEIELKLKKRVWEYLGSPKDFFVLCGMAENNQFFSAHSDGDMLEIITDNRAEKGVFLGTESRYLFKLKNDLEKNPTLTEFATTHIHVDLSRKKEKLEYFDSLMQFRRLEYGYSGLEACEIPPAITQDRNKGFSIPYIFEMSSYIDQFIVLDALKEINISQIDFEKMENCGLFNARDKINCRELSILPIDHTQKQMISAKIMIYATLQNGRPEIIPAILRLKTQNLLPMINQELAMKAEVFAETNSEKREKIIASDPSFFLKYLDKLKGNYHLGTLMLDKIISKNNLEDKEIQDILTETIYKFYIAGEEGCKEAIQIAFHFSEKLKNIPFKKIKKIILNPAIADPNSNEYYLAWLLIEYHLKFSFSETKDTIKQLLKNRNFSLAKNLINKSEINSLKDAENLILFLVSRGEDEFFLALDILRKNKSFSFDESKNIIEKMITMDAKGAEIIDIIASHLYTGNSDFEATAEIVEKLVDSGNYTNIESAKSIVFCLAWQIPFNNIKKTLEKFISAGEEKMEIAIYLIAHIKTEYSDNLPLNEIKEMIKKIGPDDEAAQRLIHTIIFNSEKERDDFIKEIWGNPKNTNTEDKDIEEEELQEYFDSELEKIEKELADIQEEVNDFENKRAN